MGTFYSILFGLEVILLAYIGWGAVYILIFAIASRFYREVIVSPKGKPYRILVMIPSFKEDRVIVNTARDAVEHHFSGGTKDVWVIADSLQPETIENLKQTGAMVLPVFFDKSTKAKSINKALGVLSNKYDYVLLLDADNVMADGFLDSIISVVEQGFDIVQGHRTAKNGNTSFAVLDGLSEEVNNAIFRKGHRKLGLSSALIGSGIICQYQLFKRLMSDITAVGGFDKELELALLAQKIRIGYAENAVVYDEKVQHPEAFINQRRRWLSAQFIYLGRNIGNAFYQLLVRGNVDYFDKVLQFLMLPRIITLGVSFVMVLFSWLLSFLTNHWILDVLFVLWLSTFGIALAAIVLSVPDRILNKNTFKSALSLPKGFILTVLAMMKVRGANRRFIHTQHNIN